MDIDTAMALCNEHLVHCEQDKGKDTPYMCVNPIYEDAWKSCETVFAQWKARELLRIEDNKKTAAERKNSTAKKLGPEVLDQFKEQGK